jgi:alpha-N-arabinofuranosidase
LTTIKIDLTKQECEISPNIHGQFIEHLGSCIHDGIWVGENSDIPNYDGLRKDVIDALKKIAPPIIRWPGGCFADIYHWRDGIGPVSSRPVTYNTNFGTEQLEDNHFGTHEFMKVCEMVGAKPWLNINMLSGSVKEMVDWSEYCNRESSTTLGQERKENGHEAPFCVEYWGIGNEAWAGGGNFTAEGYADAYRRYASAFPYFPEKDNLKRAGIDNVQTAKLIAVGPDGNKPQERVEWTKHFFQSLNSFRLPPISAYDLHFYNWNINKEAGTSTEFNENEWYRSIWGALEIEDVIKEQHKLINEHFPKKYDSLGNTLNCDIIIGEWGNWHPFTKDMPALWGQSTLRDAITAALTLDIFHNNCDTVKMACLAQAVNVLSSVILTIGCHTILTPVYYVFELYKPHRGGHKVPLQVTSDSIYELNNRNVNAIYSFASIKEDLLYINIVNTDYQSNHTIALELNRQVQFKSSRMLTHDNPAAYNSVEHSNEVISTDGPVPVYQDSKWIITVPKTSVSTYSFKLR